MTARPEAVSIAALLAVLDDARVLGSPDGSIRSLAHDSRAVRPGAVFVALRGSHVDGHDYVARARENGARAVVVDRAYVAPAADENVVTIVVPDTRRALSRLAAAFYGYPTQALHVAGVTGTNGKTTTTHMLAAMLEAAGVRCGTIGTLGATLGERTWPLENTTPLSLELQALLAEMRDDAATAVAMEVSSHALVLDRVADVDFSVAALTNVTRDHLDFHGDMESYAAAKRRLFDRAPHAIFNADDAYGERWAREATDAGSTVTTYGFSAAADLRAHDVAMLPGGSSFTLDDRAFTTRLPGRFNVANALAAIALARALGGDDESSARALARFDRVPGRMEHFGGAGIDVIVDYAHTPDALESVLRSARETTRGALHVVFGCGGDRDRGKRPQMGRIAVELADYVTITSDNPRSEEPQAIARDVVAGVADRAVTIELDRRAAIGRAIARARPGDVVVVAGKGHETYQIVGAATLHFDDREEVRMALDARARSRA